MFSSRFSPSTRTFADAVRNSRSPSPAGDGAAPVDASATSPNVPRVAIFEADVADVSRTVPFNARKYCISGVVTKYGDYLITLGTFGALISGNDETVKNARKAGNNLMHNLATRVNALQHNENQLIDHLEVNSTIV